jgi:hypothetical protein
MQISLGKFMESNMAAALCNKPEFSFYFGGNNWRQMDINISLCRFLGTLFVCRRSTYNKDIY